MALLHRFAVTPGDSHRRLIQYVLAGVGAVMVLAITCPWPLRAVPTDLQVYLWGGDYLLSGRGHEIYDWTKRYNFTYPPFAVLLFSTFHLVPPVVASAIFAVGSALCLAAVTCLWWWHLEDRHEMKLWWWLLPCAAAGAGLVEAVHRTYWLGQVNLYLLLVLSAAVFSASPVTRGVLIGLAAAIKVTPGIFVVWLLVTRQFRAAGFACAAFAASVVFGAVFLPSSSWQYWLVSLWQPGRVGRVWITSNQSLHGSMTRLAGVDVGKVLWLVAAGVVFVACCVVASKLARRGELLLSALVMAFLGLLCSPVSWLHHWVWLWPAALVAGAAALRYRTSWRGWVAGGVACCVGFWSVSRSGWRVADAEGIQVPQAWWHVPVTDTTVLLGLLVVAWAAWHGLASGRGSESVKRGVATVGAGSHNARTDNAGPRIANTGSANVDAGTGLHELADTPPQVVDVSADVPASAPDPKS